MRAFPAIGAVTIVVAVTLLAWQRPTPSVFAPNACGDSAVLSWEPGAPKQGSLFRVSALRTALVAAAVLVSHPLLDTLTDGGLGCALLWPLDDHRYFAPVNPIPVAPIGRAIFSRVGLFVMLTELALFAPVFVYALWPRPMRGGVPDDA